LQQNFFILFYKKEGVLNLLIETLNVGSQAFEEF